MIRTLLLLMLIPVLAHAQSSDADAHFKRGKVLMAEGKIAEACAAFDASQAAEENVSVMLNQGNCREKNGQLATALKLFNVAAAQTTGATDKVSMQLRKTAVDRAKKLEARVSKLTIEVTPASVVAGLVIKRNSDTVEQAVWSSAVPIDGGTYKIEASAPDHEPWSSTVTILNEGDAKSVVVPALVKKAAPVVETKPDVQKPDDKPDVDAKPLTPPPGPKPDDNLEKPKPEPVDTAPKRSRLGLVVAGVGVALLGTGLGLELVSRSKYEDAKTEGNDDIQHQKWNDANAFRRMGQGAAVIGGIAVGVGVFLYVRSGKGDAPRTSLRVVPHVSGEQGGIELGGEF